MAEVSIDGRLFQERLSQLASAWKNDLRSSSSLFDGANSMVVMLGKLSEQGEFYKNNAMHVSVC